MNNNQEKPEEYFSRNAESWLSDAYAQAGYNYPTPFHRLRIVKKIIEGLPEAKKIVDVGCGGGHLAAALASMGKTVVGVDQSEEMLAAAKKLISEQSDDVKKRVSFQKSSIEQLVAHDFDVMTAMGVIGYLPNDDFLFSAASKSLSSGGYFVVSFRNRLFNLFSLSDRTLREVNNGDFLRLYQETTRLFESVSESDSNSILRNLQQAVNRLAENTLTHSAPKLLPSEEKGQTYTSSYEARQTTPGEAKATAERCGFKQIAMYGVHPHIAVPGLNTVLPPQMYNQLCDCLLPLEGTRMALLWSSVFIGVFQKKS